MKKKMSIKRKRRRRKKQIRRWGELDAAKMPAVPEAVVKEIKEDEFREGYMWEHVLFGRTAQLCILYL